MPRIPNPYITGPPVSGSNFYGRQDTFRFVNNTFSSPRQNVVVLWGQRRMGKTSVLHELLSRLSPEFHPIYFDLQDKARQRLNEVLYDLAREIVSSLNLDSPPRADFLRDDDYFHERFLPQVYQVLGTKRLLFMFDEFETVDVPPIEGPTGKDVAYRAFFPYLRRRLVGDRRLAFIFVTGRRLDELDELILSTFKEARTDSVSFLEEAEARRLIVEPASGILEYDEEAVEQIISITACHPYLTQLICFELFIHIEAAERTRVTAGDVEAVIDEAIEAGGAGLAWLWDGLSTAERLVLSAVAHVAKEGRIATQDEISRALEEYRVPFSGPELAKVPDTLTKWGLLRHTADGHEFVVELLRRWILREHSLEQARRELELASPRAIQLYEQAFEAHRAGERDRAIRYYKYALAANLNHLQARLGLARALFEQGRLEEAITEYERAYWLDWTRAKDGLIEARQAWAETLEKEGRVDEADQEYDFILRTGPPDRSVVEWVANRWITRGGKYLAEDRYEEAVAEYEKADELNVPGAQEGLIAARRAWAEALEGDAKVDEADQQYEAILSIAPGDNKLKEWVAGCWMARGKKYLGGKRYEEAVAEYEKADELDVSGVREGLIVARQTWAEALEREDKADEADQQYDAILDIAPDDNKLKEWVAGCWMARGKKYLEGERYEEAVAEYDKAVVLDVPGAREGLIAARRTWAEALEREDKAGEADQQYDAILSIVPYDVRVREWIANSLIGRGDRYLEEGRYDEALQAYDQAERIQPEKQQALAQRRHRLGLAPDYDKAMEAHKAAEWGTAWERWTELYRKDPGYRGRDGKGKRVADLLTEAVRREKVVERRLRFVPFLCGLIVVSIVLIIGLWIGPLLLWPSLTPTPTPAVSVTPKTTIVMVSPTNTATLTPSPTETSTITSPTAIVMSTTPSPTATVTPTSTPTTTPSPTATVTPTSTPTTTPSPTATVTPTATPSPLATLGPHSILDVDINPDDNEIMYVVAKGEGIYKTTDSGYRWELIKALSSVESLTLGQANPQTVFAAADCCILKSTDGGANWQSPIEIKDQRTGGRALKGAVHVLAAIPGDDQIVYAGTDEGVYRSENGGITWETRKVGMGGRPIYTLVVASDDGQLVYAAGEGAEIWRTFEGGNRWNELSFPGEIEAIYTLGFHLASDYEKDWLYIGADNSMVAVSVDGGRNWQSIMLGKEKPLYLRAPLKVSAVTMLDFRDSETVLLAATGDSENLFRNGIYKSTDNGLSWWPRNKGLPTDSQGTYSVHSVTVDPQNNQLVYAGTFSGLYKSTDGGESWTRIP